MTKRIIFAILIILNCIVIFLFSNQVADDSTTISSRIVEIISQIIPSIKNMDEVEKTKLKEEILTPIVRKTAHYSIYTMLGFLSINFMLTFKKIKISKQFIISFAFGALYAITDEFHQLFIEGRSCELRDVCIDSLGVLTGIIIMIIIVKLYKKVALPH